MCLSATNCTVIEETPFAMAFGVKAIILTEVGLPSYRVENYDEENNAKQMMAELDLVKERKNKPLSALSPTTKW